MAYDIRIAILEQSKRANVGHIGSALSVADIMATLYSGAMDVPHPDHQERDRFILSKGHAALALYSALHLNGWLSAEQLNTYCGDGSLLGVHPERDLFGIDFTTGSLGQGLSMGAGAALAARIQKSPRRIFVLMSDAELNEGSIWEAAMFAAHHGLANLILVVDLNGQQALGHTKDVLNLSSMAGRWREFGWDVHEVDGHDTGLISKTIASLDTAEGKPHVLVAHTTFGKGVSYMQGQIRWHYMPMSEELYADAVNQVNAAR